MLKSIEIETKLYGKKIKYYEELGYILPKHKTKDGMRVPKNSTIIVKVDDLPPQSHDLIQVMCDYCGKIYPTRYDGYIKRKQNDINLDCCDECKSIKNKELNLLRYGVENQYQRKEIIRKIENINLEKYGTKYPMQNQNIKEKAMQNMSFNNGIECSRQQKYLYKLFGGELNYVDKSTKGYAIDIAFPELKIALEYSGSGHDLQVKYKNLSQKDFDNKEIIRYQILKRNGWKQIFINSKQDYLPMDNILLDEFNKALDWFKINENGHWHYNINIGDKSNDINYGKCRKITEKDLREVS